MGDLFATIGIVFRELFKLKPDARRDSYSESHVGKGSDYEERFKSQPGRALMWALEQSVLHDCIAQTLPSRVLDFATGTGRIAAAIYGEDPTREVHGIDISDSMLTVAKQNCPGVRFHLMDGRKATEEFGEGYFDFISAFRFFPNADDVLRQEVANQLAALLSPGGWLVFNNHRNFWSPSIFARRVTRSGAAEGASNGELKSLFLSRGFERVQQYSLGLWPQSDFTSFLIPWRVTRRIEWANFKLASRAHSLGYNTIWLLRKRFGKGQAIQMTPSPRRKA